MHVHAVVPLPAESRQKSRMDVEDGLGKGLHDLQRHQLVDSGPEWVGLEPVGWIQG